ncbi:ArsR family transcriptional regulator [Meiothermus sp. CFH 77666]|uniref:ArsR family transcriptional regulator n=1 Tax=Meiothermus sp. CFH 77666 TaxID=2817942 RepID=UPI001AA07F9E|nr:ArsR family transcriptional regulator [Meiothermus sp. CFH 77666]MBO1437983.1 ArsR family transcriptional regulator [Meiothermus sp. CFH 77666]
MKRFWPLLLLLSLLTACSGGGPQALNVTLVDGLGEPLQPLAGAWRLGPPPSTAGLPWNALPLSQTSWNLPIPPGTRFQVAFRCPSSGSAQSYVSLDLSRAELSSSLVVRCPSTYASPTVTVGGSLSQALQSGTAASARGQVSLSGAAFSSLPLPQGIGHEVGVFGVDSGGTPYFGRTGPISVGPGTTLVGPISLAVTPTLTVTAPPGFLSEAGLILTTSVQLPLAAWPGGTQGVGRPSLSAKDFFQFWTYHGFSYAFWRMNAMDPAVAAGATLNLGVPPLSLSGNQTHTTTVLPTFSSLSAGGFSPGLSFLGYALSLEEPGVRNWRHYLSPGALGSSSTYYVDLENAPGFSGVVPAPGQGVQLYASAFAGSQALSALLAAKPIPSETVTNHTLFLDRIWPVHLEAAFMQSSFTW